MSKKKFFAAAVATAIAVTGVGFMIYDKITTVDFGEIVIDGIPEKAENDLRIMSFNVRYCDDEAGSVKNRSKIVSAIIEQYLPDSLGVQEATGRWLDILSEALGDKYAFVGEARDESGKNSEWSAVFYLKDKFNLIDQGTIWLSETPEVKYTKSFDSICHRVATWAVLENKETGKKHTHLNTHLDHVFEETRVGQIEVLIDKLTMLQKENPVFCTGDFNTVKSSEVYSRMLTVSKDARTIAEKTEDGITFHNYGRSEESNEIAIDYIFVPENSKVNTYKIIRNTAKGMYPSDHYPIVADIAF